MHSQLPIILKCLVCKCNGLRLGNDVKLETYNEIETVTHGSVVCPRCGYSYPVRDGILNFLPVRTPNIGLGQSTNQIWLTAWGYERYWRPRALSILGRRDWPPEEEFATILRMLDARKANAARETPTHNNIAFFFDQGCSTCFYARAIVRGWQKGELRLSGSASAHVVAVDNAWPMLQESKKYIERDKFTGYISLVRADVEQLPFIDKAFAGTASGGSLNEFRHPALALAEARRTLDRTGNAAFMVQMSAGSKFGRAINRFITSSSGIKFFDTPQLARLFSEAGFKTVEQQGSGTVTISHLI